MIKVDINPEIILERRGLGADKRVQRALANEVACQCDGYIPLRTGFLKGTYTVAADGSSLTYSAPYAQAQYRRPTFQRADPMRGPAWDRRMLADRLVLLLDCVRAAIAGDG